MSIIIPKFHFFQVQRKSLSGDSMKFNKPLFSITPKSLKTININLTRGESLPMINLNMPVSAKHKGIIASEFISIHNRTSPYSLNSHVKQRGSSYILNNLNLDYPISLKNAKYRDFISCPSASFALSPSSKVALICLNLSTKKDVRFMVSQDGQSDKSNSFKNSRVAKTYLPGDLTRREFKFKELYDPKPLLEGYIKFINPSVREIMKGIFTSFASIPFIYNSVDFSASTACTKNKAIFPTRFFEEKPCLVFRFSNKFKGFKFHWQPI